jgi:hypothetical protein
MNPTNKVLISTVFIAVFNLAYYQAFEYSFMHVKVVDTAEFNAPPASNSSVAAYSNHFSKFSYKPFKTISESVFERLFDLPATGDVLADTVSVSRKTRQLLRHSSGTVYPFIPDESIDKAVRQTVMCDSYARTTIAALEYLGYVGRVVYLNGHVTMEVYDFERAKWLYIDPNYGTYFTRPDGDLLSITEFQARLRDDEEIIIHSMDDSTDDPHLVDGQPYPGYDDRTSLTKYLSIMRTQRSPYLNGHTAFEDGYGYNYRRKSLIHALKPAHIVILRDEATNLTVRLGGFGPIITANLLLMALLIGWISQSKSRRSK